ncbi:hypothetical protein BDW02DRAFT_586668 [Decorospora gaudefroyi]|uniref:Uncharacterized protein n=1 Tax=Decorospora gaudefroyi TaxID=184978 RepID=A0A6A5KNW6_9PLEO|nr:hypothetical protein BDW02DRAFT_586668 [Decorospora gaudefroyi]
MSQNPDSVVNQGEFAGHVKGSEPLMTGGHQPGKMVGNDAAPEFSAQTLPAGSAPSGKTFTPNPDLNNQKMYHAASDTLQGATSADLHAGLGHPGQGQTSSELRDGSSAPGMVGRGTTKDQQAGGAVETLKDLPKHAEQRNLGDVPTGQRGNVGGESAEDKEPVKAENI